MRGTARRIRRAVRWLLELLLDTQYAFIGPYWKSLSEDQAKLLAGKPESAVTAPSELVAEKPVEDPATPIFCQDWRVPARNVDEVRAYRRKLAQVAPDMKLPAQAWAGQLSLRRRRASRHGKGSPRGQSLRNPGDLHTFRAPGLRP
ncbi:hypothetical protein [Nonomuraea sp. NPDC046570]|uniref:hypothetical protein n=1 Tax=Nonomuraea sp. NPDC046570 TaxID=3155255 RepID=UPI00340EAE83